MHGIFKIEIFRAQSIVILHQHGTGNGSEICNWVRNTLKISMCATNYFLWIWTGLMVNYSLMEKILEKRVRFFKAQIQKTRSSWFLLLGDPASPWIFRLSYPNELDIATEISGKVRVFILYHWVPRTSIDTMV